jgi:phosphinothricin acetyltransferase
MTAAAVTVRLASEHDLPGIFEIYDEQVRHGTSTFETVPRSPAERRDWLDAHPAARYPAIVATLHGRVVGWAGLSPWSPRPAYARTAECSVYVHKDHRRQGIARLLMNDLMERARAAGIKVLVGRLVLGNDASIALHESLGFQTIGVMRRCGEKFGRILDVKVMDLHLDQPAPG